MKNEQTPQTTTTTTDYIPLEEVETKPSLRDRLRDVVTLERVGITVLVLTVVLLSYYILFPSRGFFHSDSTDTLMWAQAAWDAGALLNPDFEYACFLPIGGQLLMIPLIAVFGVSMTTHVLGMWLFFLLFTASLLFLFSQLGFSQGANGLAVSAVLLLLSGSEKLREIFWGHVIYYSLGLLFLFFGLALCLRLINATDKKHVIVTAVMLGVCLLLGAVNQFEILTLFSLPLLAALICERFFDFSRSLSANGKIKSIWMITGCGLLTAVGYLLGGWLCKGMYASYAAAYSAFSDPAKWHENLSAFFTHWTSLFGVSIVDGDAIASTDGIVQLLYLIASVVLLVAPVVATLLYTKIKDRGFRIVLFAHWIVTALVMMGFVFGRLSAANWRLSPVLATSAVVTVALCRWCVRYLPSRRRLAAIALLPLSFVCALNSLVIMQMPPDIHQQDGLYAVADELKERGLTYGYASFWNANALTVISDSAVECRNAELVDNDTAYDKKPYQSQYSWYEDQEGVDTYFVLLTADEYHRALHAQNPLIEAAENLEHLESGYYVLTFSENIF